MGAFSDNYFDLLSEAKATKKGNKGDELWSEITNVIQEQLIPFVKHYTGPFKALVRTNKPGQNGSYYLSHWCLFVINEKLSLGVKLTISKEGLSICYDFPHDKYKINKEEKVKIGDLGIDAITIPISRDKVLSKTEKDLYDDIKEYHDKYKDKYYELEKIVQGLTVKEDSKEKSCEEIVKVSVPGVKDDDQMKLSQDEINRIEASHEEEDNNKYEVEKAVDTLVNKALKNVLNDNPKPEINEDINQDRAINEIDLKNFSIGQNVKEEEQDYSDYDPDNYEDNSEPDPEEDINDTIDYADYVENIKKEKKHKHKYDDDMDEY